MKGLKVWNVKNALLNVTNTLFKLWPVKLMLFNNGFLHFKAVDFLSHDPLGLAGVVVMCVNPLGSFKLRTKGNPKIIRRLGTWPLLLFNLSTTLCTRWRVLTSGEL